MDQTFASVKRSELVLKEGIFLAVSLLPSSTGAEGQSKEIWHYGWSKLDVLGKTLCFSFHFLLWRIENLWFSCFVSVLPLCLLLPLPWSSVTQMVLYLSIHFLSHLGFSALRFSLDWDSIFPGLSVFLLALVVVVVRSLSRVWLFASPRTLEHQALLSSTVSQDLLKLMSIESVMLSNHLILCHPLILLPSIFPSISDFSSQVSSLHQVAKVLELPHQFFQWIFRVDFL